MHKIATLAASALIAGLLATAAQAQSAQIPTPANPNPSNPVATNGSPLPHHNVRDSDGVLTGRSAFAPVGAALDFGANTIGTAVSVVPNTVDTLTNR